MCAQSAPITRMLTCFIQLRSAERQTLHLVIRDLSDAHQSTTPVTPATPSPSAQPAQTHPVYTQHPLQPTIVPGPNGQPHIRMAFSGSPHPNISFPLPQPPTQTGGLNGTQLPLGWPQQHDLQSQLHIMARLRGLPNSNLPLGPFGSNQAADRQGIPSFTIPPQGSPFQPETTRTITREGVGPDGQVWRLSINESVVNLQRRGRFTPPYPPVPPPPRAASQPRSGSNPASIGGHDFYNMHGGSATHVMVDAMRRNASSSSLANLATHQNQQPIHPGVTTPLVPSQTESAASTPDPVRAAERSSNLDATTRTQTNPSSSTSPEVYILSSPSGPHAILINNDSNVYHSPQLQGLPPMGLPPPPFSFNVTAREAPGIRHGVLPEIVQRPTAVHGAAPTTSQSNTPPGQQAQVQPQQGLQLPQPLPHQFGHRRMAHARVQAVGVAQIRPHLGMALRLAFFIWCFTSPTSSWSRWITVVSLAIAFFVANTGVLNPYAEQIWSAVRRQLENLMPLAADPNRQRGGAGNRQGDDADPPNQQRGGAPDPAAAAARLVEQRRQDNVNRFLNQVRRVERAGILFVASLAPGLAEGHIAQVEAEARAERLRQQLEEEAAAAARAAAAAATTSAPSEENNDDASAAASADAANPTPNHNPPTYEAGQERPSLAAE